MNIESECILGKIVVIRTEYHILEHVSQIGPDEIRLVRPISKPGMPQNSSSIEAVEQQG